MNDQVEVPKRRGQKTTAEQRERERLRGIERRKLARAEKEVEGIDSYEALWEHNRKLLSATELEALLRQQETVFDQVHWVNSHLDGTYDVSPDDAECYVGLEEGAADVLAFVKDRGVTTMEVVLLGAYWQQPIWEKLRNGSDPTSIFARTGLVTAFPDRKLHEFQQFLSQRATQTTTPPATNGYTTMKCTTCNLQISVEAVPQSIADRHHELGIKFQCGGCRGIEVKSRAQSTLYTAGSR
jgi:hypothetical protein